jgi:general secretion pathway protein A
MYNSYFGFSVSPFRVTPDPSLFYSNPVYEEAYANLRYGIEAKKGFIVITGEVGTGKTTLLRKLMTHISEGIIHTVYVFNTYLDFTELLQVIHYDLGLGQKEANKVKLLQELNDFLITQLKDGHIVSVLVDEAQNLSDEALEGLRLLSNLETDQEKLIQIVLMGQPELQARLDQPSLRQLKQRVALQCRLVPLRDEEVCRYIDFRLRGAGYTGKHLFHPDAYRQIAVASNGIPRLVNIICDNALLCAFGRSEKIISKDIINEVAGDLRLTPQKKLTQTQTISSAIDTQPDANIPTGKSASKLPRRKLRRLARFALETCLVIVGLITVASFIDPRNFLVNAGRTLETAKGNLNEWAVFMSHHEPAPTQANAQVEIEIKQQRVIIPQGSSIYKIATEAYGTKNGLGMDLIKEFNPGIKSLARVAAGRALLLPSLTPETLLRRQADGSYRLIVASFQTPTGADEYAQRLRNKGYQVSITPRKVSEDVLLYRIEIDGLQNPEEANHIWLAGLRNDSFSLGGDADRNPLSR